MPRNLSSGRRPMPGIALLFATLIFAVTNVSGQSTGSPAEPAPSPSQASTSRIKPSLEHQFFRNLLDDQRAIWTAPFHMNRSEAKFTAPLGLATAVLIATDRYTARAVDSGGSLRPVSHGLSKVGSGYATAGAAAAFYLVGRARGDARARETGLLGAEALINSAVVVAALKAISQRPRPLVDHASGEFFDGGRSFPSGHAMAAWTLATVVACEYGERRPLVRVAAYGLATAVSLSRFSGRNHFLSDVLVGSALGYGIGRFVYRRHHDATLDEQAGSQKSRSGCRLF